MSQYFDPDGKPMTVEEWAAMFERRSTDPDTSWWRKQTEVAGVQVSTVWLGLNHQWNPDEPPLIWETMIFGDEGDSGDQWRYTSREEAFADHDRIVACLREGRKP
jgi:hypothetical protein